MDSPKLLQPSENNSIEDKPQHLPQMRPVSLETPASLQDRYRFIRQIGHGSQGKVFLAESRATGKRVAIKQLNIESVKNWKEYDLFHREAEVLRSLDIRGIAKLYETIECLDDNPPCSYIVQEYIQGQTLNDMLKAGHRFSLTRVYGIIIQLLDILEKLHSHEPPVIHRDIKPSNIILRPVDGDNYMVHLIDFGAVANPQVQSGGSTVAGTYGYMPPEQLTGKPQPASDIYALAAVAVHLMAGRSPADMPVKDFHLIFEPDLQNLPPVVVNTLRQMLEPDISKRLTDIPKIKKLFDGFLNNTYPQVQNAYANDADYDIALRNVETLGQPGNIELWQRLRDKTPRSLPKAYRHIDLNYPIDHPSLNIGNLFVHIHKAQGIISKPNRLNYGHLKTLLIVCAAALLLVGLGFGGSYLFGTVGPGIFEVLIPIGCLILLGALLLTITDLFGLFDSILHYFTHASDVPIEPAMTKTELDHECLTNLLKEGRKTIATITEVEFVPCPDDAAEQALYICDKEYFEGVKLEENKGCSLIRLDTPMFRIKYKFNPPDDLKSTDLVHEILVNAEPEGRYKPGDPLPILYRIHNRMVNGYNTEFVDSMPFPLPLGSLMIKENVFYEDEKGELPFWRQIVTTQNHQGDEELPFSSDRIIETGAETAPDDSAAEDATLPANYAGNNTIVPNDVTSFSTYSNE